MGYGSHFSIFISFLYCFIVFWVTNENKIKRILDPFLQLAYNIMLVSGVQHSGSTFMHLTMWLPHCLVTVCPSLNIYQLVSLLLTHSSLPPPASKMLGGPVPLSSGDLEGSICFQQWQKFAENNWRLLRGPFRVKSCRLLDISFSGLQGTLRAGEEASNCVCPWALIQRLQPSRPPPFLFPKKRYRFWKLATLVLICSDACWISARALFFRTGIPLQPLQAGAGRKLIQRLSS